MLDLFKKYLNNRLQLAKIEMVNILANVTANLVSYFLIVVMLLIIWLMLSFALSFWIGSYFDSNAAGFAIVGGGYVLIFIIYIVFSKDAIDNKIKDKVVSIAFHSDKELTDEYVEFEEDEN